MDYRKRAVEYKDNGHTFKELKDAFNIPPETYYDWKRKLENNYYETKQPSARSRKIDKQALICALKENPDAYLRELAEPFKCTSGAVFRMLKKLDITYEKKTFAYSEKYELNGQEFIEKIAKIPPDKLVYVDESEIKTSLQREYDWALHEAEVEDPKCGKRSKRINVIAGLCNGKHLAVKSYVHTPNSGFFENWFANCLLEEVPEGCTIIMDNATFHCKSKLRELAERAGVTVLFLPTYSPDLNPLENSWVNMERWLCDNVSYLYSFHFAIIDLHYFGILDHVIKQLFDEFTHISDFVP